MAKGKPVVCPYDGYITHTKSKLMFISCSNCRNKIRNPYATYKLSKKRKRR